jgi:hypothetical protein
MDMKSLELVFQTMLVELRHRTFGATRASDFPLTGRFVKNTSKGREFWYFADGDSRRYVGKKDDPELTKRVEEFAVLKEDFRARRKLVSKLLREGGLHAPDKMTGGVIDAMAAAGLFRLGAVVVGTVAYQTYAGILGVRLPLTNVAIGDVELVQDCSIVEEAGCSLPHLLSSLQTIDPTFRALPNRTDKVRVTTFENRSRYRVQFLTPDRESADVIGPASPMVPSGAANPETLCSLDFLIREPMRTVLLHKAGVPMAVPAPERYAVHHCIIATKRGEGRGAALKRDMDIRQAENLIEALMSTRRQLVLSRAWQEAWDRGQTWREALTAGREMLSARANAQLGSALGS